MLDFQVPCRLQSPADRWRVACRLGPHPGHVQRDSRALDYLQMSCCLSEPTFREFQPIGLARSFHWKEPLWFWHAIGSNRLSIEWGCTETKDPMQ